MIYNILDLILRIVFYGGAILVLAHYIKNFKRINKDIYNTLFKD